MNAYALRAKWNRKARKFVSPSVNIPLTPRADDTPADLGPYMLAHVHLSRCWREQLPQELEWFLQSLRGQLPPPRVSARNYTVYHIHLPHEKYLAALEALTTRLGVRIAQGGTNG